MDEDHPIILTLSRFKLVLYWFNIKSIRDFRKLIVAAVGANLPSQRFGAPRETCEAALKSLENNGIEVVQCSRWYRSAPVPASQQPDFINGVAMLETDMLPHELLNVFHAIERDFGRNRSIPNAARQIDIDLIDYNYLIMLSPDGPILPHPRMHARAFVLLPLREIAPHWRHPATGATIRELVRDLPPDQICTPLEPDDGR